MAFIAYKTIGEWGAWVSLGEQLAQELHAAGLLMRLGVSLRNAMCEALATSVAKPVRVRRCKVPTGMDPLTMTETEISAVVASKAKTWVQQPRETGFLLYQRRSDPRYVYMTDILLGTFRAINFHTTVEQLGSYNLVPVGIFHTHDIRQMPHYPHTFPSDVDLKTAAKMELKVSIIGESLGDRRQVLFLFPKHAGAWEAILESPYSEIYNRACLYRLLTDLFAVTEEGTPLQVVCTKCFRAAQSAALEPFLTPHLHMLRAELPSLRAFWWTGSLDGAAEES